MKILGVKTKNRRVLIGIKNDDVVICLKKMILHSEVEVYNANPPCLFRTNKNIATTKLFINKKTALEIRDILNEFLDSDFKG